MTKFANVYVDISYDKLDKVFQYRIPEGMDVYPGLEVNVPFGASNKLIRGIVSGISSSCDFDETKIKAIDSIASGSIVIESKLIALASYIKETFHLGRGSLGRRYQRILRNTCEQFQDFVR